MTIVEAPPGVTGGVDTHLDNHVAAALDPLGRLVGTESFEANAAGYKALVSWLEGSDTLDAIEAARAALSGRASGAGKTKDGPVEAIRVLVVAKRSARHARIKAITQMRHLGYTAPDQLHCRLKGLSVTALVTESTRLRPSRSADPLTAATKASLASLAHRVQSLDAEISELDEKIESLLVALFGVGPETAATLLVAAGDNPERLHSEAAWAHMCGVSPVPADSGKNSGHHRHHQGGDWPDPD